MLSTTRREDFGFLCWIVLDWELKCAQVFIDEYRNRTSGSDGESQGNFSGFILSVLVWSGLHLYWLLFIVLLERLVTTFWKRSSEKKHTIHTNHQEGQSHIRFDSSCLLIRNSPFLKLLESACVTERMDRREETDINQNPSEMQYNYFLLFSRWDMSIQPLCKIWKLFCFCITTQAASTHGQRTSYQCLHPLLSWAWAQVDKTSLWTDNMKLY